MAFHLPFNPRASMDSLSLSSSTSTLGRHSRRSLNMVANTIKPTRQKLRGYFTKSPRYSAPESTFREWDASDLSAAMKLANAQMDSLACPMSPTSSTYSPSSSPVLRDTRYKPTLVRVDTDRESVVDSSFFMMPPRKAPPPPPAHTPPPIPHWKSEQLLTAAMPTYSPPPVPNPTPEQIHTIPESDQEPQPEQVPLPVSPISPDGRQTPQFPTIASVVPIIRPVPRMRRQAKTPVQSIGQLEMAAARKRQEAALSRQISLRSLAKQYRPDGHDEIDVPPTPPIPAIHRKPLPVNAMPQIHELEGSEVPATPQRHSMIETRTIHNTLQPPYELPSSPISDDGTLVAFDDTVHCKPLSFASPPTPPSDHDDHIYHKNKEEDLTSSPDMETLRFQIGFELLTRELSTAVGGDRSSRANRDASGLQIWVMIEAYERLRDQIAAMETQDEELKNARAMFDSWLAALHAIRKSIADEGAVSDSEYGDEE